MKFISAVCVLATGLLLTAEAMPDIQVSLRGKKYDLAGVDTVQELQEQLSDESGVAPSKQGRVLFNGKRLSSDDNLTDAGVKDGDQLNIVPKSKSKSSTSKKSAALAAPEASAAPAGGMDDILKGLGGANMDDLMKSMGGEGAPSMQESMEMMSGMMNSPIFKEFMSDPDRLEESRQMILNNPMLKGMMAGMPGMEDLLNSPEAWREAMQAAAAMYENMDKDDLMNAMKQGADMAGGMPGGAGGMSGLFDGAAAGDLAALDELSEGED